MTARHPHGAEELCEAGMNLYVRALRDGHVAPDEAGSTPCLIDFGLLRPDLEDPRLLRPLAPAVALSRLLRESAEDMARRRQQEAVLAEAFEPLMRVDVPDSGTGTPLISVLSGIERINLAISRAMADASNELLAIQPYTNGTHRAPQYRDASLGRDQALLDRGGRIRTLYQSTLRHAPTVLARYEQLRGDAEARTLDEVTDRLIVVDRTVAFIPAGKDKKLALEIRQPALVTYLVTVFERFWHLAVPMYPQAVQRPSLNGVTPRQRAIAALLVEGHTDAVIAARLGLNVRTARVHIAKLATTLGSDSRAQLGYLIGQSGILEPEPGRESPVEPSAPEG
ncbi:helix-turn-helix transcriptional regulator [Streptomyces sp. NBC_01390]|uniref:helix-turn-helix transcriptional regulator n=1 Tax=Streptomyces sp. NBC_01390 TaxID=2903850 RepID=UPI0032455F3B